MSLNRIIAVSRPIISNLWALEPVTMALRSKGYIYDPSNAGIAGSNRSEDMDSVSSVVCCVNSGFMDLFRQFCQVCVCVCVCVCGVCHIILAIIERIDYFSVMVLTNSLLFCSNRSVFERNKNGIFAEYFDEPFCFKVLISYVEFNFVILSPST